MTATIPLDQLVDGGFRELLENNEQRESGVSRFAPNGAGSGLGVWCGKKLSRRCLSRTQTSRFSCRRAGIWTSRSEGGEGYSASRTPRLGDPVATVGSFGRAKRVQQRLWPDDAEGESGSLSERRRGRSIAAVPSLSLSSRIRVRSFQSSLSIASR